MSPLSAANEVVNIYEFRVKNVGDLSCTPKIYFQFPFTVARHSVNDWIKHPLRNAIFGGGGLLVHRRLEGLVKSATGRLVWWGAGHNCHGGNSIQYPAWMDRFSLVGTRDWGTQFEWVPCPSAMHPVFDAPLPEPKHEYVLYCHRKFPINVSGLPMMKNDVKTMEEAVRFLASGTTIITSSYHGAYWGSLLGRAVVVVNPFSSKFYGFKHPPIITDSADWQEAARRARRYPEALVECRRANLKFWANVCDFFTEDTPRGASPE